MSSYAPKLAFVLIERAFGWVKWHQHNHLTNLARAGD